MIENDVPASPTMDDVLIGFKTVLCADEILKNQKQEEFTMLNYAIIGFGGLGKSHFRNTAQLTSKVADIKLVALCDVDEKAFVTQTAINLGSNQADLDLSAYNLYNDAAENRP